MDEALSYLAELILLRSMIFAVNVITGVSNFGYNKSPEGKLSVRLMFCTFAFTSEPQSMHYNLLRR
jgi:hypothetical protein